MRVSLLLAGMCLVGTTTAFPLTFTIQPDGTGDFPTIQEAIDVAQDADEIVLASGVFSGDGNWNIGLRGKALSIRSAGDDPATCVLDCAAGGGSNRAFLFASGEGPGTVIRGVTFEGGSAQDGGAMAFTLGASPSIQNCTFHVNEASRFGGAVYCQSGCSPSFEHCLFTYNQAEYFGGACYADVGTTITLLDCTLSGNSAGSGGALFCRNADASLAGCTLHANACSAAASGIYCDGAGNLSLQRALIVDGVLGEAIYCDDTFAASLSDCDLMGNEGGDWTGSVADQFGTSGNISSDPQFCLADPLAQLDWSLESDSPCLPAQAGVLIGSWEAGCVDTPTRAWSWGHIKRRFLTISSGGAK